MDARIPHTKRDREEGRGALAAPAHEAQHDAVQEDHQQVEPQVEDEAEGQPHPAAHCTRNALHEGGDCNVRYHWPQGGSGPPFRWHILAQITNLALHIYHLAHDSS